MKEKISNIAAQSTELNDKDLEKVTGGVREGYFPCNVCGWELRKVTFITTRDGGIICPNCGNYLTYKEATELMRNS